ncbi:MAG: hypothetical protein M3377_03695 [Actinomycetota bacterium]|nr:hypothetical protein [Actinomycetota bacterium]
MSAGEVIGEAWGMYKTHWRHLLPIAFVVYLVLSLFTLLLVLLLGPFGAVAGAFVSLAGVFWIQGALVTAVEDIRDGRADLSMGETLSRVRPHLNTLGIAGILAALGITIGLILLIVPGLYLATIWALIVPVIMLEGASIGQAFGRSRELVRGNGWGVFRLIVLVFLILLAAGIVVGIVLSPLDDGLQQYVQNVVSNTLTAPFIALALTLAYYRLRTTQVAAESGPEPAPAA